MERLTEKREDKNVIPLRQDGNVKWELCNAGKGDAPTQYLYGEHADKLAAYEGTGLTPEQVVEMAKELGEYKKLEEQGLLLKLPCKVGDTVYCIHGRYTKCSAYNEKFEEYNCQGCESECDSKKEYYIAETTADAFFCALSMLEGKFGQSIFLTQEEAEAKLKEMEK